MLKGLFFFHIIVVGSVQLYITLELISLQSYMTTVINTDLYPGALLLLSEGKCRFQY